MRRMMGVGTRRDRDRKMGSKQQKERGGAQRGEEEGRVKKKSRDGKEKKTGVCHSRLILVLFASISALSAGSSHANRQAIWLHYETPQPPKNTHKQGHTTLSKLITIHTLNNQAHVHKHYIPAGANTCRVKRRCVTNWMKGANRRM